MYLWSIGIVLTAFFDLCSVLSTVPMTRTRSRNDKDLRAAGDHGQWVSGVGHSSGQPDGVPQTFRQGVWCVTVVALLQTWYRCDVTQFITL